MKLNRDVLFNMPARAAARYGFGVIHKVQADGAYRSVAGLAVALVEMCRVLGVNPRELLTAADRWLNACEYHDEQENRGHRQALKRTIEEEIA